ncbi:MAG: alpha/beta hydrolase fold domain-containing protein [Clostridiales bacterium]|nr:alpha/beta hydrolase fold domain-containing protein [Clostridiales bacterium]
MKNPMVKTLKALNFMSGKATSLAEIKRHRKQAEWAGRLAAPLGDVERRGFRVGRIRCEEFVPVKSHDSGYVILYCHGGGYISGGLDYAGNLAAKFAIATGFTVYSFAYLLSGLLMVSIILFAGAVIFRVRDVASELRRRFHL